jgi:hypothetical protein
MDYQAVLKVIKLQNPSLAHKEAQALAKTKYAEFKSKFSSTTETFPDAPPVKSELPSIVLVDAEKRIRELGVNIHSIINTGLEVIPTGEIKKHGMSGVNTLVTFEDKLGNRLPVEGHFVIWI